MKKKTGAAGWNGHQVHVDGTQAFFICFQGSCSWTLSMNKRGQGGYAVARLSNEQLLKVGSVVVHTTRLEEAKERFILTNRGKAREICES